MPEYTDGRYRWRTRLRTRIPWFAVHWVPKGKHDCGNHEWYNHDGRVDRCYHCEVGQRPRAPLRG